MQSFLKIIIFLCVSDNIREKGNNIREMLTYLDLDPDLTMVISEA